MQHLTIRISFPPSLRNPGKLNSKKLPDFDLVVSPFTEGPKSALTMQTAHMIPNAAIICLYEPFADVTDPNDGPSRRVLGAAQAIVLMLQNLAATLPGGMTTLTDVMHSSASVCLVTAARTSLIFYRHSLNVQDRATAEAHRMDIETIRLVLVAFGERSKVRTIRDARCT